MGVVVLEVGSWRPARKLDRVPGSCSCCAMLFSTGEMRVGGALGGSQSNTSKHRSWMEVGGPAMGTLLHGGRLCWTCLAAAAGLLDSAAGGGVAVVVVVWW